MVKRLCAREFGMFRVQGGEATIVTESQVTRGLGGWRGETWTVAMATGLFPSLGLISFTVLLIFYQL